MALLETSSLRRTHEPRKIAGMVDGLFSATTPDYAGTYRSFRCEKLTSRRWPKGTPFGVPAGNGAQGSMLVLPINKNDVGAQKLVCHPATYRLRPMTGLTTAEPFPAVIAFFTTPVFFANPFPWSPFSILLALSLSLSISRCKSAFFEYSISLLP